MSESTEIAGREGAAAQPVDTTRNDTPVKGAVERRSANGPAIVPPVDIVEDSTGITLYADLPGVSRERLDIRVHGGTLFIEGQAMVDVPQSVKLLHAEVHEAAYRRSFTLSDELDTDAIDASLKNGLLTLRIPRREEAQPRRIEVRVD